MMMDVRDDDDDMMMMMAMALYLQKPHFLTIHALHTNYREDD